MTVRVDSPSRQLPGWEGDSTTQRSSLRVGLVNNMPDAALDDTEHQLVALLDSAAGDREIWLRRYRINSVIRSAATKAKMSGSYFNLTDLYLAPPHALIITGAEPRCADLRDEAYWLDLARLLRWSNRNVRSAMLSCLAAHAALLVLDGVTRTPLATKRSGLFPQRVVTGSPLALGVDAACYPHSRNNDVDSAVMRAHGYQLVLDGGRNGWTVATRHDGGCSLVLLQGHPEYSLDTLMREYRRDVRRYLVGERLDYPDIPVDYLRQPGVVALEEFRSSATEPGASGDLISRFPFDSATAHVAADWRQSATRLFANWLNAIEALARGLTPSVSLPHAWDVVSS